MTSYQKLKKELESARQEILRLEFIISTENHAEMHKIRELSKLRTEMQKSYWFGSVGCDENITGFLITKK